MADITLADVCEAIVDCEHKTAPLSAAGYPSIRTTNIKNGRLDLANSNRVDHATYEAWTQRRRPVPGDLILAREAPVGEVGIIPFGAQVVLGQRTVLICPDRSKADPHYLLFIMIGPEMRHRMTSKAGGSTVDHLNMRDIRALPLPELPPLPEQRAIAAVLGALDDKIEVNRKMARVLEEIARAVFTSWFVDFDPVRRRPLSGPTLALALSESLAAFFPTRLVDSPLGEVPEIPEGWVASRLTDHFNLTMGQSPPGSTYNEAGDGLPFYQGRTDYGFRFPTPRVYCTAPTRFAEPGDTLVSVRAPVGDVNMAIERCAVGRGVAAVRHKSGSRSLTYYAMHALRAHFLRFEADGTVFGAIGKTDFERLPFVAPPPPVVAAFERFSAPIDERIEGCERQSATLAALRDTLLPKLISGELRIADAKRIVERAV